MTRIIIRVPWHVDDEGVVTELPRDFEFAAGDVFLLHIPNSREAIEVALPLLVDLVSRSRRVVLVTTPNNSDLKRIAMKLGCEIHETPDPIQKTSDLIRLLKENTT